MNLLNPVPLLYRWLALAALVAAFGGFCWFKGYAHGEEKLHEAQVKAQLQGEHIVKVRGEVTTKVETKYVTKLVHDGVVTETIIKEVPVYVPASAPDLPGGFRVLHDAAAAGVVPDPARIPDAAPVPAQAAAATVAENYGECRATAIRLQGLQEWVREQHQVK